MTTRDTPEAEGWGDVGATKWHYIAPDGRALCGRWLHLGRSPLDQGNDNSRSNCAECRRRLEKRREKADHAGK